MRACLVAVAVVGLVAAAANVGFSQAKPAAPPSIEGVWRTTSVIATGPNAGNNIPDRPFNINIWTKKYYSRFLYDGPPRLVLAPPKDPNNLNTAEKLARYEHWRQFVAVAGAYEVRGGKWFQYALVDKNQGAELIARNKTGNLTLATTPVLGQDITFEGNALVLIQTTADGKTVTRRRYTRLDVPRAGTNPIDGVWKGTSVVRTGANPATNPVRLPSIFIYKNGYYTFITQDGGLPPRPARPVLTPAKDPANLTEAEKLASYEHWAQVGTSAGRYEVKGTTLYQYAFMAINEGADMGVRIQTGNLGTVPPNSELTFSNNNNTMVQTAKSADGKSETRRTYTRLE
ncbi:MAG TPA: hypothetical protein VM818_18445 [Vicinamibacterales bacterium]|nr:hypothetical protein [Vicinamibacterales bacterium]